MPKIIDDEIVFRTVIDRLVSHGYEGATTKEIADIAGVNEVTLFRKYGCKADLFEKAIHHQLADTPLKELVYTGELEADLIAIIEAYMKTNEMYGEIIPTLLAELPRHPDLRGAFKTPWENIQVIIKIIQEYQAQGLLKQESPLASLNALIGPMMTSQMIRRANLGLPVPEIDAREHVDAFLHGRKPSLG
jgi:AcrR family transcriptional regulator